MKSLFALLVLTACAIAHNGDRTSRNLHVRRVRNGPRSLISDELADLIESDPIGHVAMNYRVPNYLSAYLKDRGRIPYAPQKAPELSMLNEAIQRIGLLPEKSPILYKPGSGTPLQSISGTAGRNRHPSADYKDPAKPSPSNIYIKDGGVRKPPIISSRFLETTNLGQARYFEDKQKERKIFAWTPMDKEYFSTTETLYSNNTSKSTSETADFDRHIRQNPNLSRDKTLVAGDLEKLRKGLNSDNLGSTAEPQDVFGFRRESVYLVAISAAVAAAIVIPTLLLAYGFYILVKRAKAGAAVDYPAYGVTGPTVDTYGDRRLAHSAQMYHYHHQKQQIIAMERNTTEQRNGSLSDPESEENEEGDYTVYECPGFATTGEMEVQNPLFDEPTPATPGKVQVVQAQPRE